MQKCGFLLLQKRKYFTLESLQALASIEPEANVIVMDIFRLRELIIINHVITSKATKYLFYWTPIYQVYKRYDPSSRNKIIKLLQHDFILSTFNYPDAHQYQLIYKGSFFRYPDNVTSLLPSPKNKWIAISSVIKRPCRIAGTMPTKTRKPRAYLSVSDFEERRDRNNLSR